MELHPIFTNARSSFTHDFYAVRRKATRRNAISALPEFPTPVKRFQRTKFGNRVETISVRQITGSFQPNPAYDAEFRPLEKSLLKRWVAAYQNYLQDRSAPLIVHQVEDVYYVESGHETVSVAKYLGAEAIEAQVWAYHLPVPETAAKATPECAVSVCAPAYALEL